MLNIELTKSIIQKLSLVTFNKNGLWIKENLENNQRIIAAAKPRGFNLVDVTIS